MIKSVLAISEGGPDAAMSFRLAARVAEVFGGTVDALHLPVGPAGGMVGGLAMSGEAMPLIMDLDDDRLEERGKESGRAYQELVARSRVPPTPPPRPRRSTRWWRWAVAPICSCWDGRAAIRRTSHPRPSRQRSTNVRAR